MVDIYPTEKKQHINIWECDDVISKCGFFADEREKEDPDHVYGHWHLLPDLLLERIFQYLTIKEKYYCSQVCWNWNYGIANTRVWNSFIMHDFMFTKRKFNMNTGYSYVLDHYRTSLMLQAIGPFIRTLIFHPMTNLLMLYDFCGIAVFLKNRDPQILRRVHTLRFHFECNFGYKTAKTDKTVHGIGGQMLNKIKELLGIFPNLQTLELQNLLCIGQEGLCFLDEVCAVCCETLLTLIVINLTKLDHTLLHVGVFVNLQTLYISPQNIGEPLLELLGTMKLRNMFIVQNKHTENGRSLHYTAWKACRQSNPRLRVHLCTENTTNELHWQPRAPIKSILFDSPYTKMKASQIMQIVEYYKNDLEVFAFKRLPRFFMPRVFHDRADSALLLLVRQCPYLHTLMIREKLSTATVLLIAHTAKNLQFFYIRKNAMLLKSDWPCSPEWTVEFYTWLCRSATSYETTEREVSQILGRPWQALTDKQYKLVHPNLERPVYVD